MQRQFGIALLLLATILLTACASAAPTTVDDQVAVEMKDSELIPIATSPTKGADDAWVSVVVFSDFQCPFCARLATTLDQVLHSFDDGVVRLVFKHFPLTGHEGARPAAQAAEAARKQGKFWEMHDAIFDSPAILHHDDLEAELLRLARELELDEERFLQDFHSEEIARRIDADIELARKLELRGAPAVFINGGFIAGVQSPQVYQGGIADVYRILRQGVESGDIAREDVYWRSVQTLYSHTRPPPRRESRPPEPVVAVPVDASRPEVGTTLEDAQVQIALFVSLAADPSLALLRQFNELLATHPGVRITFFHLPHELDEASLLAHRALAGAASAEAALGLLSWLSEENSSWREDTDLLERYLVEAGIEPVSANEFDALLDRDLEATAAFEVHGTPTFFVNGIRQVGLRERAELEALLAEQYAIASRVAQVQALSGRALYDAMVDGNQQRHSD